MKLTTPKDIIIIDPYNIAKDDSDWGPGETFDWEKGTINSEKFTDYLWGDTNKEGIVYGMNRKVNEQALNDIVGASLITYEEIENFRDKDYFKQSLKKLQEKQIRLGTFSPIVGCIGVFILDEALNYNPDFLTGLSIECYTIIKEFTGRIKIQKTPENFNILGVGDRSFYTI